MSLDKFHRVLTLILFMCCANAAQAISLEQYGISVTESGFVDNVSGLRWLRGDATLGTSEVVDDLIDQGWRIATESEFSYLIGRTDNGVDGLSSPTNSALQYDEFLLLLEILGISPHGLFESPWLCRNYGDVNSHCDSTAGPYFAPPAVFVEPDFVNADDFGPTSQFSVLTYISEAFLYGTYDTVCDTCEGRTLLVRSVPLPAGIWGFLAAIGLVRVLRKRA